MTGLVLRGIFLLRKKEIDWFYEGGAAAIYPDGMLLIFLIVHLEVVIFIKVCPTWQLD